MLYPSPTSGPFTIAVPGQEIRSVVLTSSIGQLVTLSPTSGSHDQWQLDAANLASGLYVATIKTDTQTYSKRILIAH